MGLYISDKIFGIQIYKIENVYDVQTLYEKKGVKEMNCCEMKEAYLFYIDVKDKTNILFNIYTECTSTLDINNHNFMMWYPLPESVFLKTFSLIE
jgi:hypothetical protein